MRPRQAARETGQSRYFTGKPCSQGHLAERLTSSGHCVSCIKERHKQWAAKNRDHLRKKQRVWRLTHPERTKEYRRRSLPKIRARDRLKQGLPVPTRPVSESCEICGGVELDRALALDHCHQQGFFRGWLCRRCNLGLAMFKDNPEAFLNAFRYLAQFSMPHIELIELTAAEAAAQGLQ